MAAILYSVAVITVGTPVSTSISKNVLVYYIVCTNFYEKMHNRFDNVAPLIGVYCSGCLNLLLFNMEQWISLLFF